MAIGEDQDFDLAFCNTTNCNHNIKFPYNVLCIYAAQKKKHTHTYVYIYIYIYIYKKQPFIIQGHRQ
jgi:hypothetical protein